MQLRKWRNLARIIGDSVITCVEVTELHDGEIKTIPINYDEKNTTCKKMFLYFTCLFINYRCIIDSC